MKRKILTLIIFVFLASSLLLAEEIKDTKNFYLQFTKSGVSSVYFAQYGTKDEITSLDFIVGSANAVITADFSIIYQLFPNGQSLDFDIMFIPGSVSPEDYTNQESCMMEITYSSSGTTNVGAGLNYDVSITSDDISSIPSLVFSDPKERAQDLPLVASGASGKTRTISLYSNYSGPAIPDGKMDVKLTFNPPDYGKGTAYMGGQYTGNIVVRIQNAS